MKKCVVVDLDNTLWGGIVGEEGLNGIKLSTALPGANFIAFQQALLDLYNRGVILAINSRNNPDEAWAVIRNHPNMILKGANFAAARINWNDKVDNFRELADELNIGLDSMVFLDDDPTNRAAVREFLPAVEVPDLPASPADYAKFLISLPYFPTEALTDEDKLRGNFYVTERLRKEAEKQFPSREQFLKSLGLEIKVFVDNPSALSRLAQLTEKTNQFNVKKTPMTESLVAEYVNSSDYKVFHGQVTDRFGDHGVTAMAVVKKSDGRWHIESFLLSCRVIGRGVEEAFLNAIAVWAAKEGARDLTIDFLPTERNKPAGDFVKRIFGEGALPVSAAVLPEWITVKYG
jgi:FkbH-like protein